VKFIQKYLKRENLVFYLGKLEPGPEGSDGVDLRYINGVWFIPDLIKGEFEVSGRILKNDKGLEPAQEEPEPMVVGPVMEREAVGEAPDEPVVVDATQGAHDEPVVVDATQGVHDEPVVVDATQGAHDQDGEKNLFKPDNFVSVKPYDSGSKRLENNMLKDD
jgi:hypothetical protein